MLYKIPQKMTPAVDNLYKRVIESVEYPELNANSPKEEIKSIAEVKLAEINTFIDPEEVLQSLTELLLIVHIVDKRNKIIATLTKDYSDEEDFEIREQLKAGVCYKTSHFFNNNVYNIVIRKFGKDKAITLFNDANCIADSLEKEIERIRFSEKVFREAERL